MEVSYQFDFFDENTGSVRITWPEFAGVDLLPKFEVLEMCSKSDISKIIKQRIKYHTGNATAHIMSLIMKNFYWMSTERFTIYNNVKESIARVANVSFDEFFHVYHSIIIPAIEEILPDLSEENTAKITPVLTALKKLFKVISLVYSEEELVKI